MHFSTFVLSCITFFLLPLFDHMIFYHLHVSTFTYLGVKRLRRETRRVRRRQMRAQPAQHPVGRPHQTMRLRGCGGRAPTGSMVHRPTLFSGRLSTLV